MNSGLSSLLRKIVMAMAAVVLFTSSFDIFLVVQAGGNFRLCQLFVPPIFAVALLRGRRFGFIPTLGLRPLIIWLAFQALFIPNSDFWPKSAGYCLWLALNAALMFSFVQLYSWREDVVRRLLRFYCYSFAAVAAFGIVQFALPLLGYGSPLVEQWWIPGRLARVNGFSYEPSYFATYLLIGSVLIRALRQNRSDLLSKPEMRMLSLITTVSIILSSSRMGILFLLLDLLCYRVAPWLRFLKELLRARLRLRTLKTLAPSIGWAAGALALVLAIVNFAQNQPLMFLMFLGGTGVSGATAHSVVQRQGAFSDTLHVFEQNLFAGRSLGGVSEAIAALHGASIQSFEDSKAYEGMSVFAEVLAASGIAGVIPFLWFLVVTFRKPLQAAKRSNAFYSVLLRALVRALLFTWAILQFNQNILRPYVWVHLAILAAVYAAAVSVSPRTEEITAHT